MAGNLKLHLNPDRDHCELRHVTKATGLIMARFSKTGPGHDLPVPLLPDQLSLTSEDPSLSQGSTEKALASSSLPSSMKSCMVSLMK